MKGSFTNPVDPFGNECPCRRPDRVERYRTKYLKFRTQFLKHVLVTYTHSFACRRTAERCGDHMRQGGQPYETAGIGRYETFRSVGKLLDAVQYADGEFFSAYRTTTVCGNCFRRLPLYPAGAMPVKMIFTLFGKKLDRSGECGTVICPEGIEQCGIGAVRSEQIRFPSEVRRGMRIGIGDERESVEC